MRFSKHVVVMLMSSLALLVAGIHNAHAATNEATATVTLTATFTSPPCTLTVPDQVFLGSIVPGTKQYSPFSVEINCPATTNTALYAEAVSGSLTSGSITRVDMTGPVNTGTPAQLWLMSPDGKAVVLDGSGKNTPGARFCSGNANRSCTLTPVTQVDATTPRGQTSATLRLSVAYP
ncbi:fimbrial protein [Citrobacter arsenatis]|uniref:fimbrial protein n=1 Tax=Citrobacter arsenatis TaxID=2546350 RepID=UPI00300E325B